jgi:opacity protein-like surface antigen
MQRWPVLRRSTVFLFLSLPLVLSAGFLRAQAGPTAAKSGGISFFGLYTRGDTDRQDHINNGFTFGADYTHYFHWVLTPSIELRTKFLPGGTVGENTFGGGFRLEHRWGKFVPYAGFFMSYGRLTFTHPDLTGPGRPYAHDSSIVYSAGPGLDYDVTPQWTIRADYQFERWKIGIGNGFVPQAFGVGVLYRIPFRPYQSR